MQSVPTKPSALRRTRLRTFRLVARSRPGVRCEATVGPGETVEITTGAPLPAGAGAVVPVESTRKDGEYVLISESMAEGRNISRRGEDIAPGTVVLPAGRILRPQDLGILSAIGASRIDVHRRPRVGLVVTGDELLPPGTPARDFQIPDANSVMIAALVARDGGDWETVGPIADDRAIIRDAIVDLARRCDLLLLSGGSSAGPEDHVPGIIAELGSLVVHGLALRPASPTGVGVLDEGDCPVVMLPGNPVSCLCAYDFAAGPILRRLGARRAHGPIAASACPSRESFHQSRDESTTLACGSSTGRPNRSPRAEHRSSPASRKPTDSWSCQRHSKGFRQAPASTRGAMMKPSSKQVPRSKFTFRARTNTLDHSIRSAHQIPLG